MTNLFDDYEMDGEPDYMDTFEDSYDHDDTWDNPTDPFEDPYTNDQRYEPISDSALGLNYSADLDNGNIIGDPLNSMDCWEMQERSDSCAPTSQGFVIEQLTGFDVPEDALIEISEANGWYESGSNNGTYMEDVGNLLEVFGIQTERMYGADMDTIKECLEEGGGVVVGVDADELWYGDNDYFFDITPNHAVQVIGIDEANGNVILNDPGEPNGKGVMYPIDQFVDAWADSEYFLVKAIPGAN